MIMKKIYLTVLTLSIIVMSSCDSGFDELNTSKTGATSLNPALILNNAIINASPHSGQLNWELGIVQQLISPNTGVLEGANFNKNNPNSSVQNWQGYYRNVVKYTADIIDRTSASPSVLPIVKPYWLSGAVVATPATWAGPEFAPT